MNIKIPEQFKSSKGNGKLSRTLRGLAGAVVFLGAAQTGLSEAFWIDLINQLLILASVLYSLYGLAAKIYNKYHNDKV